MPLTPEEEVTVLKMKNEELQKSTMRSKAWIIVLVAVIIMLIASNCLFMMVIGTA